MSESVGEDFPKQQARLRELLKQYQAIGPAGTFGAMSIEQALKQAEEAAIGGDIIATLKAYQNMVSHTG